MRHRDPQLSQPAAADRAAARSGPLERLAVVFLFAFAIGTFHKIALPTMALGALLLVTIVEMWRQRYPIHRDPLFQVAAGLTLYLCLALLLRPMIGIVPFSQAWDGVEAWMKVAFPFTIMVAYWVGRRPEIIMWLLAALCLGYFARVAQGLNVELVHQFLTGQARATFGDSANNFGTWSAAVFLALLALSYHQSLSGKSRRSIPVLVALFALMLIALAGLVFSQARAAWVALVVTAGTLSLTSFLRPAARSGAHGARAMSVLGLTVFLVATIGLVMTTLGNMIEARLGDEHAVIADIVAGRWDDLPPTSVGIRLHMARDAVGHVIERPLTGSGPGSAKVLIAKGQEDLRPFSHYHDSYLTILVELGLIGLALFATGIVLCIRQARHALRAGLLPPGTGLFLGGAALTLAVAATASEPLLSYRGPFFFALLTGIAYSSAFAPAGKERA